MCLIFWFFTYLAIWFILKKCIYFWFCCFPTFVKSSWTFGMDFITNSNIWNFITCISNSTGLQRQHMWLAESWWNKLKVIDKTCLIQQFYVDGGDEKRGAGFEYFSLVASISSYTERCTLLLEVTSWTLFWLSRPPPGCMSLSWRLSGHIMLILYETG